MTMLIVALALSAGIALLAGPRTIEWLRKLKFGQTIYELGPQSHKNKQGTPVMGGLLIALGCVVAFVLCAASTGAWLNTMLPLLFVSLGAMAVGFADDWTKAVKKRSEGLTPWQKIAGLSVVCVGFAVWCYFNVGSKIILPFVNTEWDLGIFYIPLLALTVLFMTNSANLQDGVDGILSSVTVVGCVGWAAIALLGVSGAAAQEDSARTAIAVFALALCGGCIGFLRFNHFPAKVFMGDTGSMFIGGAMVGMAMLLRQPFLLLLITFTCVMSSVSVILQRYYFKLTRKLTGTPKRLFKMSPIHHHFEMCGMKETQIVTMYVIVTLVTTALAVLSVIV